MKKLVLVSILYYPDRVFSKLSHTPIERGLFQPKQALLGHENVDTSLGYAFLDVGTPATDNYRAIVQIERLFGS